MVKTVSKENSLHENVEWRIANQTHDELKIIFRRKFRHVFLSEFS